MASSQQRLSSSEAFSSPFGIFAPAMEYMVDAAQRSVLFWDVMRQRGNQYREHIAKSAPHVLDYEVELIVDGRTLDRPVNYALVRVIPPAGVEIDPRRRPFVIVDPRAGHGPGIGGFKADSEIGVAFKAGHPCYFVGFLPDPMPGQTIEDIARAEAVFLEKVTALHPEADGKPCVIGNCQAGWAVMMLAAVRPELFGPIIIAGAPLSYWAGVHGKNPMRYSGGLLGGSWLTAFASDLGAGKFDGAWLVQNFENQNPANTLWTKQYNLYSKIDTEAPRYLGFERWWGGHVNLNAEEIQFIVDELFIGNNLAAGRIQTSDGTAIDLRNIRSPIVVFCSKGDNITPPQQALGWILDLYESVDELRCYGQTIVYTVHETVGHLGIFVSGGVAKKEHGEFSSNIDLIDTLPPGLYEAVFEAKTDDTANPDLATGQWVMRCETRTLDDIRALGGNDAADERRFATAARVSETNLALYRTFAQPTVRALVNSPLAQWMHQLHPLRLQYELFSNPNPMMAPVATMAEQIRNDRRPAAKDNPLDPPASKYERLIARAKQIPAAITVVVHPCEETALRGPVQAAEAGVIKPILVGPAAKIAAVAREHQLNISRFEIIDVPHSHAAAAKAVELIQQSKGELLMKGSLHTDELMREVMSSKTGLRTERRISHVFIMDVPGYAETLFITDAAINIFPDLDAKRDIVQNAIDLFTQVGLGTPRVAILSAVETVTSKIPSTIEAAALCKMADRGQIIGGILDGPLAYDNAIDPEAARIKGIKSEVAGRAQILVVPDLEAGNMLAKNLAFMAKADTAGIVLGARVPIIMTSRADSVRSRMASCAAAVLYADARRRSGALPKA
jgi:phosphotransacetylase